MFGAEIVSETGRSRTRFNETPEFPEGLYRLHDRIYAWLVPNGSWGESNAGLILGEGEALLLDTQWDLPCTREMLEHMREARGSVPITQLALTHSDGDHVWGAALLPDAKAIMSEACAEEVCELKPLSLVLLARLGTLLMKAGTGRAKRAGRYFRNMVGPYDFQGVKLPVANFVFSDEAVIGVGGREVRLIQVGPAHTRGDIIAYLPDSGIVFCGDIVFAGCTPVMWAGPLDNLLEALNRILALDGSAYVPGHGPVCDRATVLQVKEYWEFLQREIGARRDAGMAAREAAFDIARSPDFRNSEYAAWDSPERIMTNVHVAYRHLAGCRKPLKPPERISILWQQAQLASEMSGASPTVMRR